MTVLKKLALHFLEYFESRQKAISISKTDNGFMPETIYEIHACTHTA